LLLDPSPDGLGLGGAEKEALKEQLKDPPVLL